MMARRALLLLDGLDEAGQIRDEMERHVVEVLAPQGHVILATSRPAGIDERVERDRRNITTLRVYVLHMSTCHPVGFSKQSC